MAQSDPAHPQAWRPAPTTVRPGGGGVPDYPRAAWATLARTAGRYPGSRFPDDLARLATGGLMDAEELLLHARSGAMGPAARFDPRGLAWFAHLRASQVEAPERAEDTSHLFHLAYRIGGRRALAPQLDTVWVQALYLAGRLGELGKLLRNSGASPAAWWAAEADAAHPGLVTSAALEWLDILNRPFRSAELESVTFVDGQGPAFDRLAAWAEPLPSRDLPLVSVVMPVFNPGDSLRTAVNSLLGQSWPNLEILICDDASTKGTDLMAELAAQDARIRILRAPRNAGAYAARNLGIGAATGEYVTFNDADDWAHPRRVERQVRAVLEDENVKASVSWSIRLDKEMRLTVMGRIPRRVNLSSILFRRADVVRHLGGFDAVRKGADSEFINRFVTVFGQESLAELVQPLSMVQLTPGSLSRDDYMFLRTHPARLQYMADFRHWHSSLSSPDEGYVAPGCRAPFPVPGYLVGEGSSDHQVDVLLMANLGADAPTSVNLAAEVRAISDLGLSVGLMEYVGPYDMTSNVRLPTGDLAELVRRGSAVRVLPGQAVRTRLGVVRDPAAVQTMPQVLLDNVTALRTLVVADYAPNRGRHYNPGSVMTDLQQRMGTGVTWLPATVEISEELTGELPAENVLPPALFGVLASCTTTTSITGVPLRVGVSPGTLHGMPEHAASALIAPLIPEQPHVEVVLWAANRQLVKRTARRVLYLDPREVPDGDFVRQIDVLIVASVPGRGGHLSRVAATAAAQGCAIIMGPEFRGHFGPAALYLDERSASDWVDQLASSPELMERQRLLAHQFAQKHFSGTSVQDRLIRVLEGSRGVAR